MIRLFLRDNTSGTIHEYGKNPHDSLVLQEDGSIHYYNLQNGSGTMFPEEGYTFVNKYGTDPREDLDVEKYGTEPYLNIGGEKGSDGWLLLDANNTASDIVVIGRYESQEEAAEELFRIMKETIFNVLGRYLYICDGFELYEDDLEITATKSGGTIYYCDSQNIVYWDIKEIPEKKKVPSKEFSSLEFAEVWEMAGEQEKNMRELRAYRMYFIKESEWSRLIKEHSDYCGKSIEDPAIRVIFEGSIPENNGYGGTRLLFEGKHFRVIPDQDFTVRHQETVVARRYGAVWKTDDGKVVDYVDETDPLVIDGKKVYNVFYDAGTKTVYEIVRQPDDDTCVLLEREVLA